VPAVGLLLAVGRGFCLPWLGFCLPWLGFCLPWLGFCLPWVGLLTVVGFFWRGVGLARCGWVRGGLVLGGVSASPRVLGSLGGGGA
jgi:hypothetical protein